MNNTTITPALVLAIAKGLSTEDVKVASEEVGVGVHEIDALVRLKGTVKKGEDYEQVVHMKVPHWDVIEVLFSKVNGVTMESVIREAMDLPKDRVKSVKKQAEEACKIIKNGAKQTCSGNVTTKIEFAEVVEESEREAVEGDQLIV